MGWFFEEMAEPITAERIDEKIRSGFFDTVEVIKGSVEKTEQPGPFPCGNLDNYIGVYALKVKGRDGEDHITADVFFITGTNDPETGPGFWEAEEPENAGPALYCPPDILELLTPTKDRYALEWREESRAFWEKHGQPAQA